MKPQPQFESSQEFVDALQLVEVLARNFAFHAGRDLARADPAKHAQMIESFNAGKGDLHLSIEISPATQMRLSLFEGTHELVLFDTRRGTAAPQRANGAADQ